MQHPHVKGMVLGQGVPKVAVSATAAHAQELFEQVVQATSAGADIIEWRADFFERLDDPIAVAEQCAHMQRQVGESALLFTLRSVAQGGQAAISPASYLEILQTVILAHAADIIDIEFALGMQTVSELTQAAHAKGMLVLVSHHDTCRTPSVVDMREVMAAMQQSGADIIKLAVLATTAQDAMRVTAAASVFSLGEDAPCLCAVGMGKEGSLTRVLPQAFGSAITFASLEEASAPGQLLLAQTKAFVSKVDEALVRARYTELAAINLLRPDCRIAVLLGQPVAHSLSPAIHNYALAQEGLDAFYLAAECSAWQLPAALEAFRANPAWVGCNVTMPCKQQVIRHLDGLDDAAALSGAVNTLAKVGRRVRGYNTDGVGFVASLRAQGIEVAGKKVCILGAGGAASAVAAQCTLDGAASIYLAIRAQSDHARAASGLLSSLAEEARCYTALVDFDDPAQMQRAVAACDILVNATPVGMGQDAGNTPVDARLLRPGLVAADLVYCPQSTRFLQQAQAQGCTVVPGIGMLLGQAVACEQIWFEQCASADDIAAALFS